MIPGFSSTGSKRPDALYGPGDVAGLPLRMIRSSGCRVWDSEGREYLDYIMGLGAVALGYGHPVVNQAAICEQADKKRDDAQRPDHHGAAQQAANQKPSVCS